MKRLNFKYVKFVVIFASTVCSIKAFAVSPYNYNLKIKPQSELQSYITRPLEKSPGSISKHILNSDIWKKEENRYKDLDSLTSNRYTQKELEITADGLLANAFKREFKF